MTSRPYRALFIGSVRTWVPTLLLILASCSGRADRIPESGISWTRLSEDSLPGSVRVYEGIEEEAPLRLWYAHIQLDAGDSDIRVLASSDADGRETVGDLAASSGTCLAVNGGYYRIDDDVARHIGLLVSQGRQLADATRGIYRNELRYDVARAAIGFSADDSGSIGWTARLGETLALLDRPFNNSPGRPVDPGSIASDSLEYWQVHDAVAAGPIVLQDGLVRPAVDEEVFFGSAIPDVHPRTAAGLTRDGDLILMVVDGRQSTSRGVDLAELGRLMLEVGAWNALNLDGGGSSTFILNGELLNRPAGGTFQREVVSAIGVVCEGVTP